jgi:hypothetical protein
VIVFYRYEPLWKLLDAETSRRFGCKTTNEFSQKHATRFGVGRTLTCQAPAQLERQSSLGHSLVVQWPIPGPSPDRTMISQMGVLQPFLTKTEIHSRSLQARRTSSPIAASLDWKR